MSDLIYDLRHALRSLVKSPGFTLTAVLTLALGIGANTAIFSLVDRMLLRPLPLPAPDRLMVVTEYNTRDTADRDNLSYPDFLDYQRAAASFEGIAAMRNGSANLTGDGDPERLRVGKVSWNFFDVLAVHPTLGRTFRAEEDRPGGPRSALLSHGLWTRRFGADASIVGRTILLDGESVEVAGVLPKGFDFPYQINDVDLFMPLAMPTDLVQERGAHFLGGVGRLRPGASRQAGLAELATLAAQLEKTYPDSNQGFTAKVVPLQAHVTRNNKPILLILLGAVGFVLLIACANVANLLLARGAGRTRELALRTALGADRHRLVRQLLTESVALGLLGAAAGLLLARWSLDGLGTLLRFPVLPGEGLDLRILAFTGFLGVGTALIFGLLPAMQASRGSLANHLREGAKGSAGPQHHKLRTTLVVLEMALATALLVSAGLMLRSLQRLQDVVPGFEPHHLLTASLSLPRSKYPDSPSHRAFAQRLLAQLRETPGVSAAGLTDSLPLGGRSTSSTVEIEGAKDSNGQAISVLNQRVSPDYFLAMGIPIQQGRALTPDDHDAVVISQRMARHFWNGQDPLGKRFSMGGGLLTVVGVAGDVHHLALAEEPELQFYLPLMDPADGGRRDPDLWIALRTEGDPRALAAGLKAALRAADPDIPLTRARPMTDLMVRDQQQSQARSLLFGVFGLLALLLAAVGIYGVTSFLVAQRTREIGIRMALGAEVRDVLRLVMGQGLRTTALGLGLGLLTTLALGRLLQTQLFGVSPLDPLTYLLVALTLTVVALLACLLPALRAARVDPVVALRSE